jgi:hypothetical protein
MFSLSWLVAVAGVAGLETALKRVAVVVRLICLGFLLSPLV